MGKKFFMKVSVEEFNWRLEVFSFEQQCMLKLCEQWVGVLDLVKMFYIECYK